MPFLRTFLLTASLLAAPLPALAQARAGDDPPQASPFAGAFARLEEAVAQKVVGADDAASRYVSGRLSGFDLGGQARDYAAALARAPKEPLYMAILADTCMRPASPAPPECAERDAVGYFTSRDADNAVPWLLQAERARRRNATSALVDNLERAARSPRFDDYAQRAGAVWWSVLSGVAGPAERTAAALYAMAVPAGNGTLSALEAVCAPTTRGADPRIAAACLRLGGLMAERAPLLVDRRAGAQVAQAVAATDSGRAVAQAAARDIVAAQERCREAQAALATLAAGGATAQARAAGAAERFVTEKARSGEAAACAALADALR
ncbi:MAG: hypothetical protein BroJett026_12000 [Betaproteobacteria bacterium]|nr:MAG: hypothetical protein BroJett026_12000 [Betaproteobacteria bacterium]